MAIHTTYRRKSVPNQSCHPAPALSHMLATWLCLQKVGSAPTLPRRQSAVSCARSSASGVEKHSKQFPPNVRQQVLTYIDSEDLEEIAPLSTDEREKFYLSATDFEIMVHGIFKDTEGFRTARMMLQVLCTLLLQSLSSERPGTIIESSSHFSTNEALMWRDHEFHVLPNPGDPHSPIILRRIKIHLLKGYRKSIATYKEFLLMPDAHSHSPLPRFSHRRHGHRGRYLPSQKSPNSSPQIARGIFDNNA
ncbi:hypothetical protein EV421DRAFT_567730 [Armillaria borealis]|uniref:Uncharacterized protein n=1 Tax=Armillaria borealis TaxID=47425 RepID=A0AA39MQ67_9AGAR|nr:hypothetical protein EV421DRAFT_567730 [Armillaria borealis]